MTKTYRFKAEQVTAIVKETSFTVEVPDYANIEAARLIAEQRAHNAPETLEWTEIKGRRSTTHLGNLWLEDGEDGQD